MSPSNFNNNNANGFNVNSSGNLNNNNVNNSNGVRPSVFSLKRILVKPITIVMVRFDSHYK